MLAVAEYLETTWRPDREYVEGELLERNVGSIAHARLQATVAASLSGVCGGTVASVLMSVRVQVPPTRVRIPDICVVLGALRDEAALDRPPFLCIEILSRDDTMSSIQERIADFVDFGVPYVWVIDPRLKRCCAYTREGMRTIAVGNLLTEDPEIGLSLSAIFG